MYKKLKVKRIKIRVYLTSIMKSYLFPMYLTTETSLVMLHFNILIKVHLNSKKFNNIDKAFDY